MAYQGLDFEKPIYELERRIEELKNMAHEGDMDISSEIRVLEKKTRKQIRDVYSKLNRWQRTQLARHPDRPYTMDYINYILTDFIELHGDRNFADDHSIVAGMAKLDGIPIIVIGQHKGRDTKEKIYRNFGMAHPEGYRKALRLMKMAEKFNRPVITFLDTPGAFPGIGAEERGQAEAVARNLREMADLKVPIVTAVIGEGGSGGALGIGVGNKVLMMENAIYSVISPEGCASILWRTAEKAKDAAEALKITASDLKKLKVIDEIVKEPLGGAQRHPERSASILRRALRRNLKELMRLSPDELVEQRYNKFRVMGEFVIDQ
jgi:acetyl-CoA carboxylase carboxyl transferase subunit alpha